MVRHRDAEPGQEAVGEKGGLAVGGREHGRLPEAALGEHPVPAKIRVADSVAARFQVAEPGGGTFGQQGVGDDAGAEVFVFAQIGIAQWFPAWIEGGVGIAEQCRQGAGAACLGEQGRVARIEWDAVAGGPVLVRVQSCEQARSCRPARIGRREMPNEARAVCGEVVEMWRRRKRQIATPLIDGDQQNIRSPRGYVHADSQARLMQAVQGRALALVLP